MAKRALNTEVEVAADSHPGWTQLKLQEESLKGIDLGVMYERIAVEAMNVNTSKEEWTMLSVSMSVCTLHMHICVIASSQAAAFQRSPPTV